MEKGKINFMKSIVRHGTFLMAFFFLLTAIATFLDNDLFAQMCRRGCQTISTLTQVFGKEVAGMIVSFGWLVAAIVTTVFATKLPR
jgi:hypothetical protein